VTGRFPDIKVKIFYIGVKSVRVFQMAIFPNHKAKAFLLSDCENIGRTMSGEFYVSNLENIEKPSRVCILAGT